MTAKSLRTSRRSILKGLGAAAIGISLTSRKRSAWAAEEPKLNFYNWDTYIGETTLDDFAEDVWQVLVVVRAIDAGDVLVRGAIGRAIGVPREPVGVRLEEILRRAVRVHSSHDEQAVVVGGLGELTEQVAAVQELGPMMQRKLARVIGDDPTRVDDDGLCPRAFPVVPPPRNVVPRGILFGDVRLAPQVGTPVPWRA